MERFGQPLAPEIARVLDDKAWRSYLRSRLSTAERRTLKAIWGRSDSRLLARAEKANAAAGEGEWSEWTSEDEEFEWRWWVAQVLRIQVELNYRGSATLRDPLSNYAVKLTWRQDPVSGTRQPIELTIIAPPGEFLVSHLTDPPTWAGTRVSLQGSVPWFGQTVVLDPYTAALQLYLSRLEEQPFTRVPVRRATPGRPPDQAFYTKLLRRHEELKAQGHDDATVRLTLELQKKDPDVTKAAVKQWLRRGRQYLEREGMASTAGVPRLEQTWRPPKKEASDGTR